MPGSKPEVCQRAIRKSAVLSLIQLAGIGDPDSTEPGSSRCFASTDPPWALLLAARSSLQAPGVPAYLTAAR